MRPSHPCVRIASVALRRGLMMIVMAFAHSREFVGHSGATPTDLATASVRLFLTRWVTHLCAPAFCVLTGTGGCRALEHRSKADLSRLRGSRGLG